MYKNQIIYLYTVHCAKYANKWVLLEQSGLEKQT